MAGSTLGTIFRIMTWGESHGEAVGVTIDGCPAGLPLCEEDIQEYLDRRKPGQSRYATARKEGDEVELLSGVFEGKTTGTPIAMMVRNQDQRSKDYSAIQNVYRPGHADYGFEQKYGFRDYRGGGRSSARETIARVAAGAVACKLLKTYGINVTAYVKRIGEFEIDPNRFDLAERDKNSLNMPDAVAASETAEFLERMMTAHDSVGGVVECVVTGMPVGVGEPVFDKLDACLAKAVMSIGAVKGFEIGDGFAAAQSRGSQNNDAFIVGEDGKIRKETNHSGGILGGMSDGSEIVLRAAFKPTPSIAQPQHTVNNAGENVEIQIRGRHDPVVVPRAVVVVEAMTALTVLDLLLMSRSARLNQD
ncbi:MAG: chorismate synthase [Lachnospiraceae bacterium]|nr:chorismate synthase [Lachnospiraceae bacterium]